MIKCQNGRSMYNDIVCSQARDIFRHAEHRDELYVAIEKERDELRQQKACLIADRYDRFQGRHHSFVSVSRATATPPWGGASSSSGPGALAKEEVVTQGSCPPSPLHSFQQFVSPEIAQHTHAQATQTDQTDYVSPLQHTHAPDFVFQSSQASQTLEQHTHMHQILFSEITSITNA